MIEPEAPSTTHQLQSVPDSSSLEGLMPQAFRPEHCDERRNLSVVFDTELHSPDGRMEGRIIEVTKDCILGGGHVHGHSELFIVLSGQAIFTLYAEQEPDKVRKFVLVPGYTLKIPPYIAHSVEAKAGTILFAVSERPYTDNSSHTRPAIESH